MGTALTQEQVQQRIDETFVQKVQLISQYQNRRSDITLKCLECGYIWVVSAQSVLYLSKKTKNHICPQCGQKQRSMVKCAWCGKIIERTPSQLQKNKSGYFYCCIEHGNLHKNQLRRESGEWDHSLNYRLNAFQKYEHKCACCGWDEDERILEVHHIDNNHNNNQLDNLILLCPTCHRKITLGYYTLNKASHTLQKL